jgi:hypothetical protein
MWEMIEWLFAMARTFAASLQPSEIISTGQRFLIEFRKEKTVFCRNCNEDDLPILPSGFFGEAGRSSPSFS